MAEPLKILFVIDHFKNPYAGTEGQLFRLIANLDRKQFAPQLLVFEKSPYLESEEFPCPVISLGPRKLVSPLMWWRLLRFAFRFRAGGGRLAHVFFNDPSIICPPVFSVAGIKTLISRRDMGFWYTPRIERILRCTGRFVTGVVVNSQAVARITHEKERIARERVHVIPNGVIETGIEVEKKMGEGAPEIKNLKESGAVVAIVVANMRPIKRIGDAIEALARISERHPQLHLMVVGDGNPESLESLAEQRSVKNRVHFLGPRRDVAALLAWADVGILCSESEGFSNSIVEYMEHGLVAICTDTGGNPEAVTHGESGFLYPVGDVTTLSSHLDVLAENADLRREMGAKAKESAMGRFSVRTMVDAHQTLYRNVLGGADG